MRGVGAELEGDLVSGESKVGQEVADLLLTGVDDLTGGSFVDSLGDVSAELLESVAELLLERVGRQGGLARHWFLLSVAANRQLLRPRPSRRFSQK